jgi:hypothetical protein
MKLTLWQQFSSNHSARFTVVGQFETTEMAEQIAQELRQMLNEIAMWWSQYQTWEERSAVEKRLRKQGLLTPPEQKFRDQYGVGWTQYTDNREDPLDWIGTNAADGVQVYQNLVFVRPPGNTWAGAKPFDAILERLGGQVAVGEVHKSELVVTITCVAPSEASAVEIEKSTRLIVPGMPTDQLFVQIPGDSGKVPGYIERDGVHLTFRGMILFNVLDFREDEILQAIIAFLEEKHCTDIRYEFFTRPFG